MPDRDDSSGEEPDATGGDGRAPREVDTAPGEDHGETGVDEEAYKQELDDILHLIQEEKERNTSLLTPEKA